MPVTSPSGSLLAWIETTNMDLFMAAFVGEGAVAPNGGKAVGRLPATQACASQEEARDWVETQAEALGLPIRWLQKPPG